MKDKLELISSKEFEKNDNMYKVVDFLNKNLADMRITIGLSERNNTSVISIYKEIEEKNE